jgi:hypothetical protein
MTTPDERPPSHLNAHARSITNGYVSHHGCAGVAWIARRHAVLARTSARGVWIAMPQPADLDPHHAAS